MIRNPGRTNKEPRKPGIGSQKRQIRNPGNLDKKTVGQIRNPGIQEYRPTKANKEPRKPGRTHLCSRPLLRDRRSHNP
jgi:hypothetical protein